MIKTRPIEPVFGSTKHQAPKTRSNPTYGNTGPETNHRNDSGGLQHISEIIPGALNQMEKS